LYGDIIVDSKGVRHKVIEENGYCIDCETAIFVKQDGFRWLRPNGYAVKVIKRDRLISKDAKWLRRIAELEPKYTRSRLLRIAKRLDNV
jgi:hypothetical protein